MKRSTLLLLLVVVTTAILALPGFAQQPKAKNVILFLGDAGGIPTLNAASTYGYKEPRALFIQNMPHIGLSETSAASQWVTDSAAGMTAIVTGQKTHNGVVSQSASAVRGKKDGEPLKSILEYAEERGLSTGVVTNSGAASATPAACYAQANDRKKEGEIFAQILKPRFGNGVEVVIGAGRKGIVTQTQALGLDLAPALAEKGYQFHDSLAAASKDSKKLVVLMDDADFDLDAATTLAIDILSKNPKGFFLMVESDLHTSKIQRGLDRAVAFDSTIRKAADRMKNDRTLILYTADHSFDIRVSGGGKGAPLMTEEELAKPPAEDESIVLKNVRMFDDHTGEEVLLAAQGPGAERVRGILPNTQIFHIMMEAYGWKADAAKAVAGAATHPAAAAAQR